MTAGFSQRLLSVLQLTRMALVFTAIADGVAALLLSEPDPTQIGTRRLISVMTISVGLYGYGMSLNDIIDRRRDRQIAAHRPLPSGRIGLIAAHVICVVLGSAAVLAGVYLTRFNGMMSLVLLIWTLSLITFYDFAGKYLVAPGLLTLGLIRFFHATIPAPQLPVLWHPLLLLNHVAIVSTVAYLWEEKRPALTRGHWFSVLGGLALADLTCIALVGMKRHERLGVGFVESLGITPALRVPAAAAVLFVLLAIVIRYRSADIRAAGRNLMLAGLLWLIVYDASFIAGNSFIPGNDKGSWLLAALAILSLLPVSYLSVMLMRWWAKLVLLSQTPEYQRAR